MNTNQLGFIRDLISLIQERYNTTLIEQVDESETDKAFRLGCNFAYFNDLDLIESQLNNFGIDFKSFGVIKPVLGQRLTRVVDE